MKSEISIDDRITLTNLGDGLQSGYPAASIQNLITGLTAQKKFFPPEFSYDDKGSVYFDRFVETAEYYLPQKEIEIFRTHKDDLVELTGNRAIFEVGAGSSKKVAILLEAYNKRYNPVSFYPIDINAAIMMAGARNYLPKLSNVYTNCIAGAYSDVFASKIKPARTPSLFLLIGSSISQESDDTLLMNIRKQHDIGDMFMISYDLQKDPELLRSAYQNYEASMCSLNVLDHLNDTFGATFDQGSFEFEVQFNPEHKGCETHLRSKTDQDILFRDLDLTIHFDADETVRTGTQRKFDRVEMRTRLENIGFQEVKTFTDADGWYATTLLKAV